MGWHLAAQTPTELVLTALEQAWSLLQPMPGLIIHADRGSQYTNTACRARIERADALPSFSRPRNPYDSTLPGTTQAETSWRTRSEPNYYSTVPLSSPWKKPAWKWPTTSTPTSISTAATLPWATAHPTNLNRILNQPYLSSLSIFTRLLH